jgi:hypothetical protein
MASSSPSRGMDVCVSCLYIVLTCVGRGLCEELITRPKESCRVSNTTKKPKMRGQGPAWAVKARDDDDDI